MKKLAAVQWEAVLVIVVITTCLVLSGNQRLITEGAGAGWDGVAYVDVARQCWTGRIHAEAPFVYRIGTPCLAALASSGDHDILHGFLRVNVILFTLAVGAFVLYLRRHVSRLWLRVALASAYALAFHAPFRFALWAPAESVDAGLHLVMVLGLIALDRRPTKAAFWLTPIVFVGVLFREVAIILPIALFVRILWTSPRGARRESLVFAMRLTLPAFLAGALGFLLVRLVAGPTNHQSLLWNAIYWLYQKGPLEYLHAVFIAFGPVLALLAADFRRVKNFLFFEGDLGALVVMIAGLAWIGGSDTWRFLYWASPVVLVAAGKVIAQNGQVKPIAAPLIVLALLQLLSERVFLTIPDSVPVETRAWPLLTPIAATWNKQLLAVTPDRLMGALAVAQYLTVTVGLALWIRRLRAGRFAVRSSLKQALPSSAST